VSSERWYAAAVGMTSRYGNLCTIAAVQNEINQGLELPEAKTNGMRAGTISIPWRTVPLNVVFILVITDN
jgi:hypothetical protein